MIKWTGPNRGKLREALLNFYRSNQALLRFVSDRFEYSLDDLPDTVGTNRSDWAAELLDKAAAEGWIEELYQIVCSTHESNIRIVQGVWGPVERKTGLRGHLNSQMKIGQSGVLMFAPKYRLENPLLQSFQELKLLLTDLLQ